MIRSRRDLKDDILADRDANLLGRFWFLKWLYGNENARVYVYLKTLRHLEYSINTKSTFKHWYRFLERRIGLKYNISIVPNTVGKGLYIPHLIGGVIINCKAMGDYCVVNGGCVVGNKDSQDNRAIIGNHVELTLGCKVIGKVVIGDYAIIAPNSVVIKDAPERAVLSGVPAKIVKIREEIQ